MDLKKPLVKPSKTLCALCPRVTLCQKTAL
jgi:hypothetical protein